MSENTNTLFWVITGAVIVLASFLIINSSQSNTLNNINDEFNSLFLDAIGNEELEDPEEPEEPEESEIDLYNYVPSGWTVLDIVENDGIIYIAGNGDFSSTGGSYDVAIVNANDEDYRVYYPRVHYIYTDTGEFLRNSGIPRDEILAPNEKLTLMSTIGIDLTTVDYYVLFYPDTNMVP